MGRCASRTSLPSFAFLPSSVCSVLQGRTLVGLKHYLQWALTLCAPLQCGLWLLRRLGPLSRVLAFLHPLRVLRLQTTLLTMLEVIMLHGCLSNVGGVVKRPQICSEPFGQPQSRFGHGISTSFIITVVTTLQTQVSVVSIGHRVRAVSPGLARRSNSFSTGCTPQRGPLPEACRSIFLSLLKQDSYEQYLSSLVGAPE